MAAGTYNIPNQTRGDTFKGMKITIKANGTPIDLTGASIKCSFKEGSPTGPIAKALNDTTGGITILSALGGYIQINQFKMDWTAGKYYYDIEITDSGGSVDTYVKGTMNLIQDIS